ncbi:MAG: two-component sensor histidine kinase/Flp pilus assembly protein TadD [Crocinitomix sp.]|jgi:two-component sensor histidine kinase/Flp pilus assembly protein TadD
MRNLLIIVFLLFNLSSLSQADNVIELISDQSFEQVYSNVLDPCSTAESFKERSLTANDSSVYYLHIAEQISQDCPDISSRAFIRFGLGQTLTQKGNYELALVYMNLALNDFFIIEDTNFVAKTYKAIGVNYKRTSNFIEALKSFNRAAEYYHLANNKKGIASIELNIGLILKNMNRFREASLKYHSALNLFIELNSVEQIADCQNNLGNLFKNEEKYDSAFHYLYLTLASRKEFGPDRKLGFVYHNIANVHIKTGNLDSAIWYLDRSVLLKKRLGNDHELASDYFIYGNIYVRQGKYIEAVQMYEMARSLNYNEQAGDIDYQSSLELSHVYFELKDYKKSAENFELYFKQSELLKLNNDPLAIEIQLSDYQFLKDSIEMDKLRVEQELQEVKYKNEQLSNESITSRLYFILGILALIILMIVLLLISFRKRLKQAKEHRSVLAEQNEELKRTLVSKEEKETLLKEIHHRVKNNLQIISSLIRLQSEYINEHNFKERLNEIENRILSMALVHEKLYQSTNLSKLEVKSYIRDLCINILESYQSKIRVKFVFDIDQGEYSIDTLIPFGLILNETISNALKHAFYEREEGIIEVTLNEIDNIETIMVIKDNGIGADLTIDELKEDSLGMDLIFSLTEQLDGELTIDTSDGFEYTFTFPKLS